LAQAFADMLGLLSHENADIATDVLELFKELTEEDVVQDSVGCCEPICIEPASTYKSRSLPSACTTERSLAAMPSTACAGLFAGRASAAKHSTGVPDDRVGAQLTSLR